MTNHIEAINQEQMQVLNKTVPDFRAGDTVSIQVRVVEGTRERLQAFEGVVIAKRNRGLHSAFTVRKISHGEGVERVFLTYSRAIESIAVKRRGDVRRAKLYNLRQLSGRAARIREKLPNKAKQNNAGATMPAANDVVLQTQTAKTNATNQAEAAAT